jgi:hypothetical protein
MARPGGGRLSFTVPGPTPWKGTSPPFTHALHIQPKLLTASVQCRPPSALLVERAQNQLLQEGVFATQVSPCPC